MDFCSDCETFFGKDSVKQIEYDDDVNCITHFSKVVPLEGGEVSFNNFFKTLMIKLHDYVLSFIKLYQHPAASLFQCIFA